ncbi:hypothetical protein E6C27_scaffold69G00070 [Cucumis melo var. makuwa]|uniref:Uncharacterized protein n=1 Tax=Cucumis melo var. makuwa TaxID=1194695 RepID=A0A5A7T3L2_CUCMM|nr:hypothetical protein E6C27_scaffold69G00070 [Cucumis melo var. makuwa]
MTRDQTNVVGTTFPRSRLQRLLLLKKSNAPSEKEPERTGGSRAGGSARLEKQELARPEDWDRLEHGADRRGTEGSGSATTRTRLGLGAGAVRVLKRVAGRRLGRVGFTRERGAGRRLAGLRGFEALDLTRWRGTDEGVQLGGCGWALVQVGWNPAAARQS